MEITMKEVREEIDLIDKEIVLLLSQRQKCIEKAAFVKKRKSLVVDNKRIDEVISKVSNFGVDCGLSSEISVPLWTTLINLSIEHEFKEIDKLKEKA
ncbi:MAG: chorismate mutase [Gammaproteobacteria bacterium]|nr:MAG: chorismate mutase [Gammaproteobacteria bacterium]